MRILVGLERDLEKKENTLYNLQLQIKGTREDIDELKQAIKLLKGDSE